MRIKIAWDFERVKENALNAAGKMLEGGKDCGICGAIYR